MHLGLQYTDLHGIALYREQRKASHLTRYHSCYIYLIGLMHNLWFNKPVDKRSASQLDDEFHADPTSVKHLFDQMAIIRALNANIFLRRTFTQSQSL